MKQMSDITERFLVLGVASASVLFLLAGCNREHAPDCFQSAGVFDTAYHSLSEFTSIELNDYIHYELCDTSYYGVMIVGPRNLLPEISAVVEEGELTVRNNNRCNFVRSYKNRITVRICASSFADIQNYSTGDVNSVNTIGGKRFSLDNRGAAGVQTLELRCDTVNIASHTGVSDAILSGECDVVQLFNQGLGEIDATALSANYAFVNNSSLNDVYVKAHNYLFAFIQYSGNIFYSGNPDVIDTDITGEGELVPF